MLLWKRLFLEETGTSLCKFSKVHMNGIQDAEGQQKEAKEGMIRPLSHGWSWDTYW